MIIAQLVKQWISRRARYSFKTSIAFIARSLHVLLHRSEQERLCALDVYCNYVAAPPTDDLFHRLSHKYYLISQLSSRDRIDCALRHYGFEDGTFNIAYKYAVYHAGGLALWQRSAKSCRFAITLSMASRMDAGGDLTTMFEADGTCLHRLSVSWNAGMPVSSRRWGRSWHATRAVGPTRTWRTPRSSRSLRTTRPACSALPRCTARRRRSA